MGCLAWYFGEVMINMQFLNSYSDSTLKKIGKDTLLLINGVIPYWAHSGMWRGDCHLEQLQQTLLPLGLEAIILEFWMDSLMNQQIKYMMNYEVCCHYNFMIKHLVLGDITFQNEIMTGSLRQLRENKGERKPARRRMLGAHCFFKQHLEWGSTGRQILFQDKAVLNVAFEASQM